MAKDDDFISDVKERYKEATDGWRHIYEAASDDMKFVYDIDEGQWPANIRAQRETDGRPVITSNKLQKVLRRIRGDGLMNRPRLKVIPADSQADPPMAELYSDIIREIEYLSAADIAYDTAHNHAISSSVGFFRLITQFSDDMSFDQDIRIKRINNQLSVHFDPYATEFNLEDAKYCFVEDLMDKKYFRKRYPGAEISDFDSTSGNVFGDWMQKDKVKVAEYFYKDPVQKKIVLLSTGEIIPVDNEKTIEAIREMGGQVVRERIVNTHVVRWCKVNGFEVLEKKVWPGKHIPIIPVFGDEVVVDGKKYYLSLARGAKGPQQMYNYWATAATETVALAPKMPFIVDHRQIKDFEQEWDEANLSNRMYIRYNAVQGLNKPSREPQAQIPTGIMNMMQATAYDIEDHLGDYQSAKGEESNERSRVAILARVEQSNKGTYLFFNNRTRAIIYAGRQLIDLIPKIYNRQRVIQTMTETGDHNRVEVNKQVLGPDGNPAVQNDLSVGKYDLIATVSAEFASKRQEMVQMMINAMQYAGPETAQIIAPLIFEYSDWPGAQEIAGKIQQAIGRLQQLQNTQGTA